LAEKKIKIKGDIVPRQKNNKIREEFRGIAEAMANDWVVRVKPQGKKKVRKPAISGDEVLMFRDFREKTLRKFRERIIVIRETRRLVMAIF
jgi:hypothetical protein